jgi:beta-glucosidase
MKEGYVDMEASPLYEFGYGLSYTTFDFSNLSIDPQSSGQQGEFHVSCDVQNTGKLPGAEVVQLYINDNVSSVARPVKELKGFEKVFLNPGEKKKVEFVLTPEELSFLDRNMKWVVEPGKFSVMVGNSSEKIKLNGELEIR